MFRSSIKPTLTQRQRRLSAMLLAVALCVWTLASAMHVHVGDEHLNGVHAACGFCLSSPTAAPPPATLEAPTRSLLAAQTLRDLIAHTWTSPPPSFYFGRAPPASSPGL